MNDKQMTKNNILPPSPDREKQIEDATKETVRIVKKYYENDRVISVPKVSSSTMGQDWWINVGLRAGKFDHAYYTDAEAAEAAKRNPNFSETVHVRAVTKPNPIQAPNGGNMADNRMTKANNCTPETYDNASVYSLRARIVELEETLKQIDIILQRPTKDGVKTVREMILEILK